jgi:predicted ABC-type ATPase
MILPILNRLKDGEKFDFETLADNSDQTDEFWEWWWENNSMDVISRPETISDHDPILVETVEKMEVDLATYSEFFLDALAKQVEAGKIQPRTMPRMEYGRQIIEKFFNGRSVDREDEKPLIIFAGGGYGSGKTTILNQLANQKCLSLPCGCLVGVDMFKLFIPEFSLIQSVADGRASFTVQKECKNLASQLYSELVESKRSFIWDSSMSDRDDTLKRIEFAKRQGYDIQMIAVLTPLSVAIRQAMGRAYQIKRFPHSTALPQSHVNFRAILEEYIPLFDKVEIFAKMGGPDDIPEIIAVKEEGENKLAVVDKNLLHSLTDLPINT